MKQKRPRGRPKGTEINDSRYLDKVADLIAKQPELKKTPAIARVVTQHFPEHQHSKVERRLLRKWNKTSEERLAAAKERHDEARRPVVGSTTGAGRVSRNFIDLASGLHGANALAAKIEELANPKWLRVYEQQAALAQRMQDIVDPPFMRRIREQQERVDRIMRGY
ncbi:MAG: hypothetical protein WA790_02935 [Sulfitobacter sp.]